MYTIERYKNGKWVQVWGVMIKPYRFRSIKSAAAKCKLLNLLFKVIDLGDRYRVVKVEKS